MRREHVWIIEGMLRDFPRICAAARERARYLEAMSHTHDDGAAGGGGQNCWKTTEQEAVLKAQDMDRKYQEMLSIIECLGDAFRELPADYQRLVGAVYWEGYTLEIAAESMGISARWAWKLKTKALRLLRDPCFKVLMLAERWREEELEQAREFLRLSQGARAC